MKYSTEMKIKRFNQKPYVTYILVGITTIIYLMQLWTMQFNSFDLPFLFGAKVNEAIIMGGQWYRLITPMFLHLGISHILINMVFVYFLGTQLEKIFGHWRYFLIYFLSGIMGNAFSFALNRSISVGASTSVFGLFAATVALTQLFPGNWQIKQFSKQYSVLILINILFGIFSTGIDNMGHLGGLIGGYLLAFVLSTPHTFKQNNPKGKRFLFAGLFLVLLLIAIFWGYNQFYYLRLF